ncbi:MAG: PSD1 and planctomycete cytochrome C domain-containing protein [Aureliella sp.]
MRFLRTAWICGLLSLVASSPTHGQSPPSERPSASKEVQSRDLPAEQVKFFEARIRPVLVQHCYACHSADSRELGGGLQMDGRDGLLAGGDSGPAVIPGKPEDSLLLTAIRQTDRDLVMPPKEAGPKLSASVIADFEKWIRAGAIDPRSDSPKAGKKKYDPEAAKSWWAWQPRNRVTPPPVSDESWVRTPLDRFVLSALDRQGLHPVPDADRATLVRRLAFDLTGLPPTVPELYDYALSPSPRPLEDLVDRYLDSPAYGERMARHWLDVARYAESAGKDFNGMFPHAWRYRDYVIDAFNADMPYRDFVVEQIAGDLLPSRSDEERGRQAIATGFLAIGPKGLNEMNPRQYVAEIADEQIDTLSQAFLGLTVACARCHDHKFDPISQRDYTAMAGIFLSTETHFGSQGGVGGRNRSTLIELPESFVDAQATSVMSPDEIARRTERLADVRQQQQEFIAERARERLAGKPPSNPGPEFLRIQTQLAVLETDLGQYRPDGSLKALAMGVSDKPRASERGGMFARRLLQGLGGGFRRPQFPGAVPPELQTINDSPLFERGDVAKPGQRVPRGLPVFFTGGSVTTIPESSSGRLELAHWIASSDHPLTARVMVNRIWSWTMGRGLVASVDNFGTTGDLPSNPELLDYLAGQFIDNDWSVKSLVRTIVLSRTYALSSAHDEANFTRDPDNQFHWRANPRMLEAEAVRDAMLSASGKLDLVRPHGSLISRAGDGVIGGRPNGPAFNGLAEDQITGIQANYRSLYLPIPRNLLPDALELFDFPDNSMVHGVRESTLVPSQSLFWMNSPEVDWVSRQMAQRVFPGVDLFPKNKTAAASQSGGKGQADDKADQRGRGVREYPRREDADVAQRFADVCLLALSRQPLAEETAAVEEFVREQTAAGIASGQIWTSVCRSIISSADFRRLR